MADETRIFLNNRRAWTGVTQAQQTASEVLQNSRSALQAAYEQADGTYGTPRDAAAIATIEAVAAARQNPQGVFVVDSEGPHVGI